MIKPSIFRTEELLELLLGQEVTGAHSGSVLMLNSCRLGVWTFHYLKRFPLCWGKEISHQEGNCVKKQLTAFMAYFSAAVSLGGMGPR